MPGKLSYCEFDDDQVNVYSSTIIDYIAERFEDDKSTKVVYFYWNHQSQQQQTATKFMATLLKQLLIFIPFLPPTMKAFYESTSSFRPRPESKDLEQVTTLFFEICKQHLKTVFIALDALDECSQEALTTVLAFFNKCSSSGCFKIIATSRPNPASLQSLFKSNHGHISCIEIEADNSDVKNFLENRLAPIIDFDSFLKTTIVNKAGSGIEGMH